MVKHTEHARTDLSTQYEDGYIAYYMTDMTTTTYYVHSTVLGGKTIEELDQNGIKTKGYVYSGGARVATQNVSGSMNSISFESTNPVTEAVTTTDANGTYAGRQEPDPLGRDQTAPPDPLAPVITDPLANSKLDHAMYIEYQESWTGEMESGMAEYVDAMEMVEAREAYTRWLQARKSNPDLINKTNADYNIWQSILTKSPNVGVFNGKKTFWGSDGSDYLQRHAGSIFLGDNGEIFQRKGGRILLIVGDPGLNHPGQGSEHQHDVGDNFMRVARTKQQEFEDEGYEVILKRASTVSDFASAMSSNGMLDGVEYIGHGRNNALFIGEQPGSDCNPDRMRRQTERAERERQAAISSWRESP